VLMQFMVGCCIETNICIVSGFLWLGLNDCNILEGGQMSNKFHIFCSPRMLICRISCCWCRCAEDFTLVVLEDADKDVTSFSGCIIIISTRSSAEKRKEYLWEMKMCRLCVTS
jgi:hypothetical protein